MDNLEATSKSIYKGRKRGRPKRTESSAALWMRARGIQPASAAEVLANCDERRKWYRLLNSEDDSIVLRAMAYLSDKRDGRASQQINITSQNITMNASDLERAREIVREIRASVSVSPHDTLAPSSPLQGDATGGASQVADSEQFVRTSIMLAGDEGGKKDGME